MTPSSYDADTIIVGAGFAGLSAAASLTSHGQQVMVLEARARVGGRSSTRTLPNGVQVDEGAQWICNRQPKVTQLVQRYGLTTYETPVAGRAIVEYAGEICIDTPKEVARIYDRLDRLSQQVGRAPWEHSKAVDWDYLSFAEWLAQQTDSIATQQFIDREMAGGILACSAHEASLLTVLFCCATSGGVKALLSTEAGAQSTRVVGGTQRLAECMAADLSGIIRLNHQVTRINCNSQGVQIAVGDRMFTSRNVIVAVPPRVVLQIAFTPGLSLERRAFLRAMRAGNVLKMHIGYDEPFWRHQGLSGFSQTSQGYVFETYDGTPPNAQCGILTAFSYGREADVLRKMNNASRQRVIVQNLAALFGVPALRTRMVCITDWSADPATLGGFSGHMALEGWTAHSSQFIRHDSPVYWAGTEYATEWNGYIEGAIASGQQVAKEIMRV